MKHYSPDEIRTALEEILPGVQKPTRYLGIERNLVRKPWDGADVRVALAFPDAYEIGMSHQGTRILYHLVNRRDDALAERTFAPMPDMAEALRGAGLPLFTLETYRAVAEFDIIGISLQSELNYINIPYLLDLAGIARRAAKRGQDEPIVIGGGPCTANPEPVADFFDAILIGDGEAALDEILDTVRDGRREKATREEILTRLAAVPGVYVPTLYRWHDAAGDQKARWETVHDGVPFPVQRVWVDRLDSNDQPESVIVPYADVIQDRLGMEIMRGCTQGCRFCQAGYWYRPVREHDPKVVLDRMQRQVAETGFEEVGLLSLSTADYSQVEPLVYNLAECLQDQRVSISLPSLRADAFSVGLAEAVSRVRKSGFTFAPETGSDRLRRVINKTFTNAEMVRAAEAAFSKGWELIKVYAIAAGRRATGGRKIQIKVSAGCFVPKAWTPFQWQPYAGVNELRRRIGWLKQRFRRIRGARLTWSDPEEAALESLLSRGNRGLGAAIERAHDLGAVFDGWTDYINLDAWRRALDDIGIDVDHELGERALSDTLPWDLIDAGVRKGFLKGEWRRAVREAETEDCKWGHCYRCGIPGDGDDIQLASTTLPVLGEALPDAEQPRAAAYHLRPEPRTPPAVSARPQQPVHRRYRFVFSKIGDARWLSHRQLMDALERMVRAAGLPVRYTEGFNPHIRLSMGPALPVGYEGRAETFDVDCTAPLCKQHLERANALLPRGVEILDARPLLPGAPKLGRLVAAARYRIAGVEPWPETETHLSEEIRAGIRRWQHLDDGALLVELNARQEDGPQLSVKKLLLAIGIAEDRIPRVPVTREMLVLEARQKSRGSAEESSEALVS
jgi:radical SAM-linked protein